MKLRVVMLALWTATFSMKVSADSLAEDYHRQVVQWVEGMNGLHFSYTNQDITDPYSNYGRCDCRFYFQDSNFAVECTPIYDPNAMELYPHPVSYFRSLFLDGIVYVFEDPIDPHTPNVLQAGKQHRTPRLVDSGLFFLLGRNYSDGEVRELLSNPPIAYAVDTEYTILSYWMAREHPTSRPKGMDLFLDAAGRVRKIQLSSRACCTLEELRRYASEPVHRYAFLHTIFDLDQYVLIDGRQFPSIITRTSYEVADRTKTLYLRKMYWEEKSIGLCEMNLRELLELDFVPTAQEVMIIDPTSISFDGNWSDDVFNPEPREDEYTIFDLDSGRVHMISKPQPWLKRHSSHLVLLGMCILLLTWEIWRRIRLRGGTERVG